MSLYYVNIYSNDGETHFISDVTDTNSYIVTPEGLSTASGEVFYTYTGPEVFNGFATSRNQQTPEYELGSSIELTNNITLYIVERSLNGVVYYSHGLLVGNHGQEDVALGSVYTDSLCGVLISDNIAGTCTKDNLYVNYDGTSEYNQYRQLVIQSNTPGEHLGSNVYQYAAVRGDALANHVNNTLGRTTAVQSSDTNYTTLMARGTSLHNAETDPTVNGAICWQYS